MCSPRGWVLQVIVQCCVMSCASLYHFFSRIDPTSTLSAPRHPHMRRIALGLPTWERVLLFVGFSSSQVIHACTNAPVIHYTYFTFIRFNFYYKSIITNYINNNKKVKKNIMFLTYYLIFTVNKFRDVIFFIFIL